VARGCPAGLFCGAGKARAGLRAFGILAFYRLIHNIVPLSVDHTLFLSFFFICAIADRAAGFLLAPSYHTEIITDAVGQFEDEESTRPHPRPAFDQGWIWSLGATDASRTGCVPILGACYTCLQTASSWQVWRQNLQSPLQPAEQRQMRPSSS
jgi:hypothetical protein